MPNTPFSIYLSLFSPLLGMLVLILIAYLQYWLCKRYASNLYPIPLMWKRFKWLCGGLILVGILAEFAILPVATFKNFVKSPYMILWNIEVICLFICGIILIILVNIYGFTFLKCLFLVIKNKTKNLQQTY
jgi:hypothetical protein